MKKSKIGIRIIGCMIVILTANSCSIEKLADSLKCDPAPLLQEANVEKIFYEEALEAYNQDQSTGNCQELKNSGSDYISAVQQYIDCSEAGDEQIKREQRDAEKVVADLEC